jgi:putative pyruvate formate lyase activating enzyme
MVFRFHRLDSEAVWKNKIIRKRFARYRNIIDDKEIARYIIAKSIECDINPNDSIKNLEDLLIEKSKEFNILLNKSSEVFENRQLYDKNFISLVESIASKYLENCCFCERKCHINRAGGETGFCNIPKDSYVSSAFLHTGEEAPLVPSGTIFFQGCNFSCVFCQNYDISQLWKNRKKIEDIARKTDPIQLANLADRLVEKGAININYVGGDPIPNIHTIVGSLQHQTSNITQLWNSNFYLTEESLSLIIDFMDFWLPDFKYGNNSCAEKYSGISNYYDVVTRNLKRIHNTGSGEIIIRHLVMPNHIECCSKPILDFIAKETPMCVVNIMAQFRPEYLSQNYKEINRRPSSQEVQEVRDYADKLRILCL